MALILRLDVDKPYDNMGLLRRILSKIREDYYFPVFNVFGYLGHTKLFIKMLGEKGIQSIIFFRNCTRPHRELVSKILRDGHKIGFHAENTSSKENFICEFEKFKKDLGNLKVIYFTKHGSGTLKLGRRHYVKYESEKYRKWASELGIVFHSGNLVIKNAAFSDADHEREHIFWIDRKYWGGVGKNRIDEIKELVEFAKHNDVVVLVHPSNYTSNKEVKIDFDKLVETARKKQVKWKMI